VKNPVAKYFPPRWLFYNWENKVEYLNRRAKIIFNNSNESLSLYSCLNNYMPNNQFKRGELYSFITGKASTAIARRLQKNFKQANLDITIEQWSVLYHLWKQDGLSQQQLCDATFRDKPSITRLVDNLERLQLVKRVASKDDRRINMIYLTREAAQLQEQTMELANQTLNEALEGVTHGQVEIAKEVLQKVYDNLSSPSTTAETADQSRAIKR
jgi:DNA-binding MarR family transcriptional regulator